MCGKELALSSIDTHLKCINNRHFLKTLWKKKKLLVEIACNEPFLLFPQCFLLNQKIISPFVNVYDIISLIAAEFEEPKTGM